MWSGKGKVRCYEMFIFETALNVLRCRPAGSLLTLLLDFLVRYEVI